MDDMCSAQQNGVFTSLLVDDLLSNLEQGTSPRDLLPSPENVKVVKEDFFDGDNMNTFLGSNLWESTIPFDPDFKDSDYLELGTFLGDNDFKDFKSGNTNSNPTSSCSSPSSSSVKFTSNNVPSLDLSLPSISSQRTFCAATKNGNASVVSEDERYNMSSCLSTPVHVSPPQPMSPFTEPYNDESSLSSSFSGFHNSAASHSFGPQPSHSHSPKPKIKSRGKNLSKVKEFASINTKKKDHNEEEEEATGCNDIVPVPKKRKYTKKPKFDVDVDTDDPMDPDFDFEAKPKKKKRKNADTASGSGSEEKKPRSRGRPRKERKPEDKEPKPKKSTRIYLDEDFDPTEYQFDVDELTPQPVVRKGKKKYIPDDSKDEKYWKRREKNNVAAKRSRDARRAKENHIIMRANFLEAKQEEMRKELDEAKEYIKQLEMRLSKYEDI